MPYVRDSFWRGREFTSIEHMQAEAVTWCPERRRPAHLSAAGRGRADGGVRGPGGGDAAAVAGAPFVLARWSTPKVGPDIHIKVGRALYSVPWKLIGRKVDARSTATMVQVFLDGELVKTHAALEQGKRTDRSDYPPEKIAFLMRTPIWCRTQALPRSATPAARSSTSCWRSTRCTGSAPPRGSSDWRKKFGADAPGSRLREGDRGRRPVLPHHQGHPGRRHRDRSRTRDQRRCGSRGLPPRTEAAVRLRDTPPTQRTQLRDDQVHGEAEGSI